jgi:AcrR family transcriptional regulator
VQAQQDDRDGRKEGPGELGPLPGGHHGLSRAQILESQRERLLAAMAHEVAAHGYRATTITEVVKFASARRSASSPSSTPSATTSPG